MINNILVNEGYKVGKFISPHLIKYNERISINGQEISDKEMSDLIEELKPKIEKYNKDKNIEITLFELETTMALLYFYRNQVDFVILEVGLGGLYDCTNIIENTLVSVITSIGYDHMHILGKTLPEITYQKAGIIKENSNTVFFEQSKEVNEIFINKCIEKNNNLHLISKNKIENHRYDREYQYFDYDGLKNIVVNLKGIKQIQNASICIESMKILNQLGYQVSEESIRKGLSTVIHKGRLETLSTKPLIIYDGAHNVPAIENLQTSVNMYYKNLKRTYIVSILKRKDYEQMIKLLLEDEKATFILTSGNDEKRYASSEELYDIATKYSNNPNIYKKTLKEALKIVMESEGNIVNLIVGSFYTYNTVVEEIMKGR